MRVSARQVLFRISKEKEAELYAFILRECACSIYLLQTDEQECGAPDGEDEVQFALIVHRDIDALPYTGGVRPISLYGVANQFAFLRLERLGEADDGLYGCRLWLPDLIGGPHQKEREQLFRKIKDWIRRSAVSRIRDGLTVYRVE